MGKKRNKRTRSRRPQSRRWIAERLEDRRLLAGFDAIHNSAVPADVNGDGDVTLLDAMVVVQGIHGEQSVATNGINAEGEDSGSVMPDVNDDGEVSLHDALQVVRAINAEGEGTAVLISDVTVNEKGDGDEGALDDGDGQATFTISFDGGVTFAQDVILQLTTTNGPATATAGTAGAIQDGVDDFVAKTENVTIPAGTNSVTFNVDVLTDNTANPVNEDDETFTVSATVVQGPDGTMLDVTDTGTGTIQDGRGTYVHYFLDAFANDRTTPVTEVDAGDSFRLRFSAQDVRNQLPFADDFNLEDNQWGLGGANIDISYDPTLGRVNSGTSNDNSAGASLDFDADYSQPGLPPGFTFYPFGGTVLSGRISDPADIDQPYIFGQVPSDGEGVINDLQGSTLDTTGADKRFIVDVGITAKGVDADDETETIEENDGQGGDDTHTFNVLAGDSLRSGPLAFTGSMSELDTLLILLAPNAPSNNAVVGSSEMEFFDNTVNVVQPAGASLTLESVSVANSLPANGLHQAAVVNGAVEFTAAPGFSGVVTLEYIVSNGIAEGQTGRSTDTGTVTITVEAINDAPVAVDDPTGNSVNADTVLNDIPVGLNDSDPEGDDFSVPTNGTDGTAGVILTPEGMNQAITIDYDPRSAPSLIALGAGVTAQDTFTYTIEDEFGGRDTATVTVTVTGVNDAPTADDTTLTTAEDVNINGDLSAISADVDTGDVLEYAINGMTDSTIALTNGTITNFNKDTGTYTYEPNENFFSDPTATPAIPPDSFTYSVTDGSASASGTVTINVTPVNDAPTAGDAELETDEDVNITNGDLSAIPGTGDIDSTNLTYAVVDQPANGSVTTFNSTTGTFHYQPALNFFGTDTFTYSVDDGSQTDGNPAKGTVTITVNAVNDAPTAADTTLTTEEDVDITNGDLSAIPGTGDVDDTVLTYAIVDGPSNGAVTDLNTATGTFTYKPNQDFFGQDTFTYSVDDGSATDGNPAQATVTITVTPVNDAPTAGDAELETDEDVNITDGDLSAIPGTGDVDSTNLTYAIVDQPGNGEVTDLNTATGTFTYKPNQDFFGTDTFTYSVSDGSATDGNPAQGTVTITVNPVEDDPFANNSQEVVPRNSTGQLIVLDAGDPDNEDLTWMVSEPTDGDTNTMDGSVDNHEDGTFTFSPDGNFGELAPGESRTVTVNYTVKDGRGVEASAVVTIEVTANQRPIAVDDPTGNSVDADTVLNNIPVGANDSDPEGDDFSVPTNGTVATDGVILTVSGTNQNITVNYDPRNAPSLIALGEGVTTQDTFTYTIEDEFGGQDTATVTVEVTGVNEDPTAGTATLETDEDIDITDGDLSTIDGTGDADSNAVLTYAIVSGPNNGTIIGFNSATGTFTYDPNQDFFGNDSFTYTVTDEVEGSTPAQGTVNITVNAVNDAPTAEDTTLTTDEDVDITNGNLAAIDGTGDVDDTVLTYAIVDGPSNGAVTDLNTATGTFTYKPNPDFFGQDTFTYSVDDGSATEGNPAQATVTITVTPVNDAPTAGDEELETDEDVNITDGDLSAIPGTGDVDDTNLTYAIVNEPAHGEILGFNASTGTFTYKPDAEYNGSDSFTYSVSDGSNTLGNPAQGTVNITINPVNDDPIANDDVQRIFTRGGTQEVTVIVNDLAGPLDSNGEESEDRTVLKITGNTTPVITSTITEGVTPGDVGNLELDGDAFLYTPPEAFEGTVKFSYTLSDGVNEDTAEVTLNIRNADPSTITGVVYADYNNNGVQDAGEPGINNVAVTLTGNDDFGEVIEQTVTTDVNGVYLFDTNGKGDELAPSSVEGYTVTVGNIQHLGNGTHSTAGDEEVADNDEIGSFSADVTASTIVIDMSELGGVNAVGNFAKRSNVGWLDLDGQWDTVANDNDDGFLYATNTDGDDYWNLLLNDFDVHSLEIDTSLLLTQGRVTVSIVVNQGEEAQVRVVDMTSKTSRMYFHAVDNPRSVKDFVLRFEGNLQDFLNLQAAAAIPALEGEGPVSAEDLEAIAVGRGGKPVYERAVDAAFGDGLV